MNMGRVMMRERVPVSCRLLLGACVTSAAIACSGGDAEVQEDALVVLDSMGVEIVQNPERAPDSTSWSLDTVPRLVIGHDESKGELYLFGSIAGAASLSDGRIVVSDRQPPGVRMFDSVGAFVRQIGRVGQGPGEYTSVGGVVVLAGDTFAVRGGYVGRATQVFDPGGDFVRTLSAPLRRPDLWEGRYGQPSIVSFFTDGTVLAGASFRATPGGLATEPRTPMVVESHRRLVRAQAWRGHSRRFRRVSLRPLDPLRQRPAAAWEPWVPVSSGGLSTAAVHCNARHVPLSV